MNPFHNPNSTEMRRFNKEMDNDIEGMKRFLEEEVNNYLVPNLARLAPSESFNQNPDAFPSQDFYWRAICDSKKTIQFHLYHYGGLVGTAKGEYALEIVGTIAEAELCDSGLTRDQIAYVNQLANSVMFAESDYEEDG